MEEQPLLQRLERGVLTLTLNRPDRLNAMTREMTTRLYDALVDAGKTDEVRAIVLTGSGRGFCAGGDVKAMAAGPEAPATLEARTQELRRHMESSRLLHEMPKPTIAMVRGPVAGAGLSLALACDLLICSDTLKMTSAFVKVGLSGDYGGTYFLTKRLGHKAREIAFLSPVIGADEALRLGLANRVVPDAELEQRTYELAEALASGPGITLGHIKANLNFSEQGATLAEALDFEALRHTRCHYTEDHMEAAAAFVEKRAPVFKNR